MAKRSLQRVTLTRLVTLEDASALAELLRLNRDFLAPWDPVRDDEFFTVDGQFKIIQNSLDGYRQGTVVPRVVLGPHDQVVGRISLTHIARGAYQSCTVGYWIDASHNGRGLATAALHELVQIAFDDLQLHRVDATTQLTNLASQRVLERAGFTRYGVAPEYLNIDGDWKDVALYQRTAT